MSAASLTILIGLVVRVLAPIAVVALLSLALKALTASGEEV